MNYLKATIALCTLTLFASACLDLAPPPSAGATPTPTSTPTPTIEPTATPVVATPTATSTVTPTPTSSPTPTVLAVVAIDPATGLPGVAPGGTHTTITPNVPPAPVAPVPPAPSNPSVPSVPSAPPLPSGPGPAVPTGATSPTWGCDGDERIDFVPAIPKVGDMTFIFVTASRDRDFGLLLGPGVSGRPGEGVAGGSGLKRSWVFTPTAAGAYSYSFYGGPFPEHLCVASTLVVTSREGGNAGPVLGATATPTHTSTPVGSPRPDH